MLHRKPKHQQGDAEAYLDELENPQAYADKYRSIGVGYGRPPVHTRFKPGQSGNPSGRPKGSGNVRQSVEKLFTDKINIRVGGRVRKVTMLEAVLLTNLQQALKGDQRAIRSVHATATALGLMDERPQKLQLGDLSSFTDDELVEFSRLLEKASAKMVPK